MRKRKTREGQLPMEFNPMLNKFEPVLPLRKKSLKIERKRNWWAFWYIIISVIILLFLIIVALKNFLS